MLVANAPYVPTDQLAFMPAEARLYEAEVALDGGTDGLDVQRRVIAEAPDWLAPGGTLLIETSRRQSAGTVAAGRGHDDLPTSQASHRRTGAPATGHISHQHTRNWSRT